MRTDGQTGSGKTFTIYGNEQMPGLTPRGVSELYHVMDRDSGGWLGVGGGWACWAV